MGDYQVNLSALKEALSFFLPKLVSPYGDEQYFQERAIISLPVATIDENNDEQLQVAWRQIEMRGIYGMRLVAPHGYLLAISERGIRSLDFGFTSPDVILTLPGELIKTADRRALYVAAIRPVNCWVTTNLTVNIDDSPRPLLEVHYSPHIADSFRAPLSAGRVRFQVTATDAGLEEIQLIHSAFREPVNFLDVVSDTQTGLGTPLTSSVGRLYAAGYGAGAVSYTPIFGVCASYDGAYYNYPLEVGLESGLSFLRVMAYTCARDNVITIDVAVHGRNSQDPFELDRVCLCTDSAAIVSPPTLPTNGHALPPRARSMTLAAVTNLATRAGPVGAQSMYSYWYYPEAACWRNDAAPISVNSHITAPCLPIPEGATRFAWHNNTNTQAIYYTAWASTRPDHAAARLT